MHMAGQGSRSCINLTPQPSSLMQVPCTWLTACVGADGSAASNGAGPVSPTNGSNGAGEPQGVYEPPFRVEDTPLGADGSLHSWTGDAPSVWPVLREGDGGREVCCWEAAEKLPAVCMIRVHPSCPDPMRVAQLLEAGVRWMREADPSDGSEI